MKKEDKVIRPSRDKALHQFLGPRLRRYGLYFEEDDRWYPSQQIRTKPKFLGVARGHRVARFGWWGLVVVEDLKYYAALVAVFSEWEEYWGEEITLSKQVVRRPAEDPDIVEQESEMLNLARRWRVALSALKQPQRCEYCGRLFEGEGTGCVLCGAPR